MEDNIFFDCEKLYRAVFPQSRVQMFWKKDGTISSAALADKNGLSVECGDFREDIKVIEDMQKFFNGCIVSLNVEQCRSVNAIVKYKPSQRSKYHSEIHGSENTPSLSKSQRKKLAEVAKMEYYEN